jgi:hypothetical protein
MADRKDWFFRQIVAEDELDSSMEELEQADRDLAVDMALGVDASSPDEQGGIVNGLNVGILAGTDITVSAGVAYDLLGQRCVLDGSLTVDLAKTGSLNIGVGGLGDGSSTDVGVGNERWVTLFLVFDRLLSDPRTDGASQTVYFERDESFHFEITMGSAVSIGTLGLPSVDGPPRQAGKVLIADIRLEDSGAGTEALEVQVERREQWFKKTGTTIGINVSNPRQGIDNLFGRIDDHVSGVGGTRHIADSIDYAGGDAWADGTTNPAVTVEVQLDKIITDLNATVDPSGAKKIGALLQNGTLQTPNQGSPLDLAAGTLEAQLTAIMDAVNGRVFRGGDNSIAGNLEPSADGFALGRTSSGRWDAFFRDISIEGVVNADIDPGGAFDLGNSGARWSTVWVGSVDANVGIASSGPITPSGGFNADLLPTLDNQFDLGSASFRWLLGFLRSVTLTPSNNENGLHLDMSGKAELPPDGVTGSPGSGVGGRITDASGAIVEQTESFGRRITTNRFVEHFHYNVNAYGIGSTRLDRWQQNENNGGGTITGNPISGTRHGGFVETRSGTTASNSAAIVGPHIYDPGAAGSGKIIRLVAHVEVIDSTNARHFVGFSSDASFDVQNFWGFVWDSAATNWRYEVISGGTTVYSSNLAPNSSLDVYLHLKLDLSVTGGNSNGQVLAWIEGDGGTATSLDPTSSPASLPHAPFFASKITGGASTRQARCFYFESWDEEMLQAA